MLRDLIYTMSCDTKFSATVASGFPNTRSELAPSVLREGYGSAPNEARRIFDLCADKRAILDTLDAVAKETGATAGQVAIAWISAHGIIPILGARTKEQLEDNLAASDVHLSPDQILRLEEVSAVSLGFPHDVVARKLFRSRLLGGKLGELELPVTPVA
jgi:hypothetical protein